MPKFFTHPTPITASVAFSFFPALLFRRIVWVPIWRRWEHTYARPWSSYAGMLALQEAAFYNWEGWMLRPWPLHSMCCCRNHFLLFFIHFCRVMATAKFQPQEMMWKSGIAVWLFGAAMLLLELHYDWKFLLCMFELRLWVSELGWIVTMMHFSALTFLERLKWPDVSLTRFWKTFFDCTLERVFLVSKLWLKGVVLQQEV